MTIPFWKQQFEKTAADPVKEQHKIIINARVAVKHSEEALKHLGELQTIYSEDKAISKIVSDCKLILKRVLKIESDAAKKMNSMSKKGAPKQLKSEAAKAKKAIEAKLVDPKSLKVIPWQQTKSEHNSNGEIISVTEYQMVFRIENGPYNKIFQMQLSEKVGGRRDGQTVALDKFGTFIPIKDFVPKFLEGLKGWDGLRGESNRNQQRSQVMGNLEKILNSVVRKMGFDYQRAEINGRSIEAGYRSDLPKEGAYEVGSAAYDRMVSAEIKRAEKAISALLRPYKDQISRVRISDGEKSWIYYDIELK